MLHPAIAVLETAALVWLTHRLATSLAVSHAAVQSAETARSAEAAAHAREADLQANAQAAGHVQAVAVATEALSTSVSGIGGHVGRAAQIASEPVARTVDTSGTMKRLAGSADRIEAVVKLINGIAGQTDLLALNATIEAARAAEAARASRSSPRR